ncbi:MAG: hypothetical protein HYZ28_22020 [Myxococcales bacterium]|nr:hypothetical protein [Myxococcales bacterium]
MVAVELTEVLRRECGSFAPELSRLAYERGLAVTAADGTTRPIPVTATPVVLAASELRRRVELSALLASAGLKMSRAVLAGPDREVLLSALSPLERSIAERTHARVTALATTRVDFFVTDRPMALELNATIPAMQGYSDIAAGALLVVVGRHLGMSERAIASLEALNGSNALALYRALVAGYARERSGEAPERIALLCRRNDAQLTEQRYLCERFRELGTDADVVHPDQLSGEDRVWANGKEYDLIYRHLFVRRLEDAEIEGAGYVRSLFEEVPSRRVVVLNPPASQVEVKTTFAFLSRAASEPKLAKSASLTEGELEAVRQSVPWTRQMRREPGVGPHGERLGDLVAYAAAHPDELVLKRAWDYGGRAVFVGQARGEHSFEERVRSAYKESLGWPELCERCAADPGGGGFVVQRLVPLRGEPHLLCSGSEVVRADLYVDFSAYASVGLGDQPPWGGVCRGSASQIVNIVGGGRVLPLLTSEVAAHLLDAWRAASKRAPVV